LAWLFPFLQRLALPVRAAFLGSGERAPAVSTCLPKEHLDNGAVKFRDNCTGEWRRRP
jgi:hypothetical protein